MPTQTSGGYALVTAIPKQDPSNPAVGATIDRLRAELPAGSLIGGAVAENHDLQAALTAKTPLVIGVVLGARVPAAADRAAGAADRRRRRAHQPARDRRRVRRRQVGLPGRRSALAARLPAAGVPRRVGTGVLLRDDLRDLDGLHGVPALERQGTLGPHARPQGGDDRRARALRPRDLRRRRRDGRRLLHLRAVGPAAAQGDGNHPRRRRPARRRPDPAAAAPGAAAPDGHVGLVPAALGAAGSSPTSPSDTHEKRTRHHELHRHRADRSTAPCATRSTSTAATRSPPTNPTASAAPTPPRPRTSCWPRHSHPASRRCSCSTPTPGTGTSAIYASTSTTTPT